MTVESEPAAELSRLLGDVDIVGSCAALARAAGTAAGARVCDLALYDETTGLLHVIRPVTGEDTPPRRFEIPLEDSVACSEALSTDEALLSNQAVGEPPWDPQRQGGRAGPTLIVPLKLAGSQPGLLVALDRKGGFGPVERATLQAFAAAVAQAIDPFLDTRAERQKRALAESIVGISRTLVGTTAEDTAFGAVLDQIWRVLPYHAAAVLRVEGRQLQAVASRGGGDTPVALPLGEAGELDVALDEVGVRTLENPEAALGRLGLYAPGCVVMAAPLRSKDDPLGLLVAAFEADDSPGQDQGETLMAFAEQASFFLGAALQLRRERQARVRAAALGRFTRLAATRHEPKALLQAAAAELLPLSGADWVVFYAAHSRNAVLIPRGHAGVPGSALGPVLERIDITSGPLRPLLEEQKPLAFEEGEIPEELSAFQGARHLLFLPLAVRDVLVGAVGLACILRDPDFDAVLVEFLHDVVQPIALGMENSRLFSSLATMATTDELTGLANRRKFMDSLRIEVTRSARDGASLSLLIVDVDHLKRINDTHGHPAGDKAIRHVADRLTRRRRATDLPARLGGEEFGVLLPAADREAALLTAERICREVADTPIPPIGRVTVSIGLACLDEVEDGETLIRLADQRLYAAKESGRNRVYADTLVEREAQEVLEAIDDDDDRISLTPEE